MPGPAGVEPRPGLLLGGGRYRLDQLIGSGGMATVWQATDRRLGRTVAVKLISEALADDPTYAERFAREARTAAGLSHANLVQVFDYGAGDRRPYLVMEYIDGGTLAQRLERGPVVGEEARAVAGDLLAALGCIHSAGILHRDIKPANVLLSSDGRARITDFGIAHPEDSTRLTQTGHLVGTLRYLAPEVIDGQPPSRKSDLYALGVLLRDLTGGRTDETTDELVVRLTDQIPARRPATAEQARKLLRAPRGAAGLGTRRGPRLPRPGGGSRLPRPAGTSRTRVLPGGQPRRGSAAAGGARWRAGTGSAAGGRRRIGRIAAIAGACGVLVVAAIILGTSGGSGGSGRSGTSGTSGGTGRSGAAKPVSASTSTSSSTSRAGTAGLTGRLDELERLVRAAGQP
jgi:hypothetical protein